MRKVSFLGRKDRISEDEVKTRGSTVIVREKWRESAKVVVVELCLLLPLTLCD